MVKTKKQIKKIEKEKINFRKEFKKALNTGIIAAAGLIVAFAWRDVLTGYIDKITSLSPVQGKVLGAFIVTTIAVIVIMVVSKYTSD